MASTDDLHRLLLDSIVDYSVAFLDPAGVIATWSRGAELLEGWTRAEAMGQDASRGLLPEAGAKQKHARLLDVAMREGTADEEGEHAHKDGSRFWAHLTYNRILGEHGEHLGFARVLRPLPRAEGAEQLASLLQQERESRARLLRPFMQSPLLLAVVRGPEHVYEFANDRYRQAVRLPDPVGHPFGGQSNHAAVPLIRAQLDRVYRTGEPYFESESRVELRAAEGEPARSAWFHLAYHPVRDARGEVEGVMLSSVDVTEVVEARHREADQNEALAELRDRVHAVVQAAPIIIWAIDTEGRFTLAEGRGMGNSEFGPTATGQLVQDRYKDFPLLASFHARALRGESVDVEWEGRARHYQLAHRPLKNQAGDIVGALGVATDITDRKRAEEEREKLSAKLLQVQKLESLGVLAGGIAHDFNNILTAILGSASLAGLRLPAQSPARGPIDDVVTSTRRAADLTRQLLAYSGKAHFDVRPIDLSAHVREIAHLLEATLPKKAQLRLELAVDLPATLADVAQVQQVVMNLVINGAEALGDERGTVLVTTGAQDVDELYAMTSSGADRLTPGRYVFLEVHDTGAGMDEATREKMFDPFFTTKFHGRGLGLAAVLGIVRGHRGAIRVYSQVGKGTAMKVLFPASEQPATERKATRAATYRGEGTILFVDDEPAIRHAGRQMLEHFGFDVLEAADGREAVSVFERFGAGVRAIILDMTMPQMSGEEAFRELRRLSPQVVVILSSGYNEIEATRKFTSKGLAGFLQKPYSPDELAEKLEIALARGS